MTFAETLTKAAEKAGMTLTQVAVASGYSYSAIYKFATGATEPPDRTKPVILDAIKSGAPKK